MASELSDLISDLKRGRLESGDLVVHALEELMAYREIASLSDLQSGLLLTLGKIDAYRADKFLAERSYLTREEAALEMVREWHIK